MLSIMSCPDRPALASSALIATFATRRLRPAHTVGIGAASGLLGAGIALLRLVWLVLTKRIDAI